MKTALRSDSSPVLLCVHAFPDGGGIQSIVEAVTALLAPRYEVHVAIIESDGSAPRRLRLPTSQVHVRGYSNAINPILAPTSLAYLAATSLFLRRIIRSVRPIAILVQDAVNLPCPALIARFRFGAPLVIMDHGTLPNQEDPGWRRIVADRLPSGKRQLFKAGFALDSPWRAARVRLGLLSADAALYVGDELAPYFKRWAGARAHQYSQPASADFRPPSISERRLARDRFGVTEHQTVVNMVTRLDGEKGLADVVSAIRALATDEAEVTFLIAGRGSLDEELRSEAERMGGRTTVRLLGRLDVPDLERLHHASDFHLYAGTIGCGLSVALLEAMKCQVLPVVSDVPRAHRALIDGAGWVFRAGDRAEMKRALSDALATNGPERERRREILSRRLAEYERRPFMTVLSEVLDREQSGWRSNSRTPALEHRGRNGR